MTLGERMVIVAFAVKGRISLKDCKALTDTIIDKMQMVTAYPGISYRYPLMGKGGNGYTHFQTITDSFIAWDVWPDFHGAYLFVCSCKDFDVSKVQAILEENRLEVKDLDTSRLYL